MSVYSYQACGYEGSLVSVDVEIRNGLPGFDIVGLPGNAVRESRERVRAAIRNSGFSVPPERVLISLAPAGIPKDGSSYDLPIALAILLGSGQLPDPGRDLLALGELTLSGAVSPVHGVLAAVATASREGLAFAIVPGANHAEARTIRACTSWGVSTLSETAVAFSRIRDGKSGDLAFECDGSNRGPERASDGASSSIGDYSDVIGCEREKRALAVAAAGMHGVLLVGPPGAGKSMLLRRLPTIMSDLGEDEALEVTTLHSLAGALPPGRGLVRRPPFRDPHHSASLEGLLGGGRFVRPGEISLAHRGILFLDEAPEFRTDALQALREPVEEGRVSIARANGITRLPARFLLAMAANACPCGNLGKPRASCACSFQEVERYWRKIGGALLDRIDIRLSVKGLSTPGGTCVTDRGATDRGTVVNGSEPGRFPRSSSGIAALVRRAVAAQTKRYEGTGISRNAQVPPGLARDLLAVGDTDERAISLQCARRGLSSRAYSSIMKLARSCADLDGSPSVESRHLAEAMGYRAFGEDGNLWES